MHFMGQVVQTITIGGMKVFILDEISPKINQKKRWE